MLPSRFLPLGDAFRNAYFTKQIRCHGLPLSGGCEWDDLQEDWYCHMYEHKVKGV